MILSFKEWMYGIGKGRSPAKLMSSAIKPAKPYSFKRKKK
jgi:hypothetical protein